MGSAYAKYALKLDNPRVGLLNNGAEETKGGKLQKEVYAFLAEAAKEGKINFIGNVEGSDVLSGKADVVVTDGFTGNVMLKSLEGMAAFFMSELKSIFYGSTKNKIAALAIKKDFKALKNKLSVGGSIMLGICKPVVKAHGSSKAADICAAVEQAFAVASSDTMEEINKRLEDMKVPEAQTNMA